MTDTPYSLRIHDEVTSTQDLAREAAVAACPVLVVAARQTSGRGRSRRRWETAPRAMAASLAFRPPWPSDRWPLLPLAAGLAAAEALGSQVRLKWPNDLLMPTGKVGGILVESSGGLAVAGCGVNLWWPDPPAGVAALEPDDPGPDRFVEIATFWAGRFLDGVEAGPDGWGIETYRARCDTIGRAVVWEPGGAGRAVDVDGDGRLVVDGAGGRTRLTAGEVRHLRAE